MDRRTHAPAVGPTADAPGVLVAQIALLLLLPAALIVGPLGAPGAPANLFGLGLLLWWGAARTVPSLGVAQGRNPLRTAVLAFGVSAVASYLVAATVGVPPQQLTGADRGLLSIAAWMGMALVAADLVGSVASVQRVVRAVVALAAVVAAIGVVQFATGVDLAAWVRLPGLTPNHELAFIGERSMFRRVAGTTSHPIELGVVLAMVVPLALHVAFNADRHRGRWWGALMVILLALPMTLSRAAILGLAVALLVLLPTWSGARRAGVLLGGAVLTVAMRFVVPGLLGTLRSLFEHVGVDPSISGRTDDYAVIGEFIGRSPWLGRGFGTFLPSDYFILDNQYLGLMVDTGAVGLVAFVLLLATGVALARRARARSTDPVVQDLGACLASSVVVATAGMLTFDGLAFPVFAGLLFVLLGLAGALWRVTRPTVEGIASVPTTAGAVER